MFCLITSSKLSRQKFEFSLKVMGLNLGYLLKSFLLYPELSNLLDLQDFPDLLDYPGFLVLSDSLDPWPSDSSNLVERSDFLNLQDLPYLLNLQEFSDPPDHLDLLDLLNL